MSYIGFMNLGKQYFYTEKLNIKQNEACKSTQNNCHVCLHPLCMSSDYVVVFSKSY